MFYFQHKILYTSARMNISDTPNFQLCRKHNDGDIAETEVSVHLRVGIIGSMLVLGLLGWC